MTSSALNIRRNEELVGTELDRSEQMDRLAACLRLSAISCWAL
jgi:hypothetical protein